MCLKKNVFFIKFFLSEEDERLSHFRNFVVGNMHQVSSVSDPIAGTYLETTIRTDLYPLYRIFFFTVSHSLRWYELLCCISFAVLLAG